jgi:hypothetical protein
MAEALDLLVTIVRLEHLRITIVPPSKSFSTFALPENTTVRCLHELSLNIQIELETAPASLRALSQLPPVFLRIYPSVQRLVLMRIPLEIFNIYLGTLTSLRFLRIHGCSILTGAIYR